jgi:hypothetical protein
MGKELPVREKNLVVPLEFEITFHGKTQLEAASLTKTDRQE